MGGNPSSSGLCLSFLNCKIHFTFSLVYLKDTHTRVLVICRTVLLCIPVLSEPRLAGIWQRALLVSLPSVLAFHRLIFFFGCPFPISLETAWNLCHRSGSQIRIGNHYTIVPSPRLRVTTAFSFKLQQSIHFSTTSFINISCVSFVVVVVLHSIIEKSSVELISKDRLITIRILGIKTSHLSQDIIDEIVICSLPFSNKFDFKQARYIGSRNISIFKSLLQSLVKTIDQN